MSIVGYRARAIQHARLIEQTPSRSFLGAYLTAAWPSENHVDHCYIVWSAMVGLMSEGGERSAVLELKAATWSVVRAVLASHKHITGAKLDVGLSHTATIRCFNVMIPIMAAKQTFSYAVATHPELQSWAIQRALISVTPKGGVE